MSIHKVVDALNAAFAADQGAMRALVINHVPCNMGLVNDPYVICEEDRNLAGDHFMVGMLGVINGVLAAAGMPLVAAKWDMREDGPNIFAGFIAYIPPKPVCVADQSPQPDQYWQHKTSGDRAYFIGRTPEGTMVWQCEGDNVEVGDLDWSEWEYLEGCDSWEWKQCEAKPAFDPDEFPQYWTTIDSADQPGAYIIRKSPTKYEIIRKDGTSGGGGTWERSDDRDRTQITKAQAEALEIRRPKPVVEATVVQYQAYYVNPYWTESIGYIVRLSATEAKSVDRITGEQFDYDWNSFNDESVSKGVMLKVTEAEAKSRINQPVTEQKFPQYVKDCCGMIFRADSPDRIFWLPIEGGEHLQDEPALHWAEWSDREPLTEFEIGEIINRSIQAEGKAPSDIMGQSPDDWVLLDEKYDDCPLLPRYQYRLCRPFRSWKPIQHNTSSRCGRLIRNERKDALGDWEFRCRRSDLPVVNARIPVALYWYDGAIVCRYADSPVTDPSFIPIHSDGNGGWFIERSTNAGN